MGLQSGGSHGHLWFRWVVSAGERWLAAVYWNRNRSDPWCPAGQPELAFRFVVRLFDVTACGECSESLVLAWAVRIGNLQLYEADPTQMNRSHLERGWENQRSHHVHHVGWVSQHIDSR